MNFVLENVRTLELAMAQDGCCIGDKNMGMLELAMAQDELCVGKCQNVGVGNGLGLMLHR